LLIPEGVARENHWLENESKDITRAFLSDVKETSNFIDNQDLKQSKFHHYPIHSFSAWMKEMRMLGFIQRTNKVEDNIFKSSTQHKAVWLQLINSDILSSVEKESPHFKLRMNSRDDTQIDYTIWRSERAFEGEEYLSIIENEKFGENMLDDIEIQNAPHLLKLKSRVDYLLNNLDIS